MTALSPPNVLPALADGRREQCSGDATLVSRVRAGDAEAFAAIYDRHSRKLFALCLHMLRDRTDAEDALQQTFLNAWRSIEGGAGEIRLGPWLHRIARNECLSRLRARRDATELDDQHASAGVSARVEQREELRELLRDLKRLPEEQATAITLSAFGDLSHREIGDVLGCEARRVKALVYSGHRSLAARREARAKDCADVRELLDTLNGGSLRRVEIRDHLLDCAGCRDYKGKPAGRSRVVSVWRS
jgi:RNA polymerase sigma factor (sigma-70 family)